ncbi:MAG: glycosyltransferase family 4 protein [Phycisphaeraceae bacterium]
MNLAVVCERFTPFGGGVERSTAQIAQELVARGHRVTILAADRAEGADLTGAQIRALTTRRVITLMRLGRFAAWARRQLDGGQFDASLSVTTVVPATVLEPRRGTTRHMLERLAAASTGVTARLTQRLGAHLSPSHLLRLQLERRTLRDPRVQRVVAVSRYLADQLERDDRISPNRIEVIPNGAVMPAMSRHRRQTWQQQIRQGFGVPQADPLYLFVADNPRLKGIDPLLRAVKLLKDRGAALTLLIAGRLRYPVQHLAATLGVRDRVRFVGITSHMPALYAAADVTVLPTFHDPASKVVIESLMMSTPVITTIYDGAADFVVPGGNGSLRRGRVLTDPINTEALAEAMLRLADPAERRRCRAKMAGLTDELSMARHVDRLEVILAQTAQGRTTAGATDG